MALNPTGPISLGGSTAGESINLELSKSSTAQTSLNDADVRTLAAVPGSGTTIIMPTDFWGKSSVFNFTLGSGTDVNLRTAALGAGWPGTGAVQATIPAGSAIQASSTGSYALTVDGAWPGGVTVINNGTLYGRGGNGAQGGPSCANPLTGSSGGPALYAAVPVTFNNASGTINGGGGGGGGGGGYRSQTMVLFVGTGSGGGGGIVFGSGGAVGASCGGINSAGQAGQAGTLSTAGSRGVPPAGQSGPGGNGGSYGSTGASGSNGSGITFSGTGSAGGAGGAAVVGNSNITWPAFGTRNGAIT
jgi:hypothetical protein